MQPRGNLARRPIINFNIPAGDTNNSIRTSCGAMLFAP
jgi:hypothetical protein